MANIKVTRDDVIHTVVIIFGVIANIALVLALLSIIVGIVWVIFPLKDEVYMGSMYICFTPLGGRETGLVILVLGFTCLALGFLLDKEHVKLIKRFGSRS